MPLSEHEQRLLEQMERALHAEDPKLAAAMRGADLRVHHRRRALLGVVVFLLGVVLLFTGLVVSRVLVSVLGFVVMLGAAFFAVSSWRQMPAPGEAVPRGPAPRTSRPAARGGRPRGGMMDRIEDRWRRRREQDGL